MADRGPEVPPIPVPPVEPAPRASRAKKPAAEQPEEATVMAPLVDLAGGAPSASPYVQPDPYAQPTAYVQPNPYAQPNPYSQGQPPGYPAAPQAYAAQPQYYGVSAPSSTLSIVSMVLGIVGFLAGFVGIGLLPGIAAVITGHLAQRRQPHAKAFWITGLITGYLSVLGGLITGAFFIWVFVAAATSPDYYY